MFEKTINFSAKLQFENMFFFFIFGGKIQIPFFKNISKENSIKGLLY